MGSSKSSSKSSQTTTYSTANQTMQVEDGVALALGNNAHAGNITISTLDYDVVNRALDTVDNSNNKSLMLVDNSMQVVKGIVGQTTTMAAEAGKNALDFAEQYSRPDSLLVQTEMIKAGKVIGTAALLVVLLTKAGKK